MENMVPLEELKHLEVEIVSTICAGMAEMVRLQGRRGVVLKVLV